jgi:hypothetical protein
MTSKLFLQDEQIHALSKGVQKNEAAIDLISSWRQIG